MILPFSLHNRSPKARLLAAASALAAVGLLAWLAVALLTDHRTPKVVADNISRNFRVCLINGQHDSDTARTVWSALQKSASGAAINAEHIQVPNSGTTASLPYINSLVQRHCGLIISVGPDLHNAVTAAARHNPHQQFITIGPSIKRPNVQTFSPADQPAIISAVQTAARPRSQHRS
ncbi:hypothetical protein [Streptomyces sp. Ru72]|uniref:hypothetical protein n=1 Tax=Streptomyces sp. Ru72 TaxID=2080747 RepID=UPI0011B08CC9|nr:hypothetical protein [Streptomyces sp. Ru72]